MGSRRDFLKTSGLVAGGLLLPLSRKEVFASAQADSGAADYTLRIATKPIELAKDRIISATTYNGQFPGPLLRFQEGKQVTIDVYNDTDTPEQLHWHGQAVPSDVDGASEAACPFFEHLRRRFHKVLYCGSPSVAVVVGYRQRSVQHVTELMQ